MPVGLVAYFREHSPIILGAAAVVNAVCAVIVGLDRVWWGVALFGVMAGLFATAAFRAWKQSRGREGR